MSAKSDECPKCPSTSRNDKLIVQVCTVVQNDTRLFTQQNQSDA